jgi:hypothetical protein
MRTIDEIRTRLAASSAEQETSGERGDSGRWGPNHDAADESNLQGRM